MSDDEREADPATTPPAPPQLRVVRGDPDAAQLAALLAVVAATGDDGDDPAPPPARGRWADPGAFTREPGRPGPGGWRAAGR